MKERGFSYADWGWRVKRRENVKAMSIYICIWFMFVCEVRVPKLSDKRLQPTSGSRQLEVSISERILSIFKWSILFLLV